jgi:hypothetical protein
MRGTGQRGSFTAKGSRHCLMGPYLMGTGRKGGRSGRGCANIQMGPSTLAAGTMDNHMGSV